VALFPQAFIDEVKLHANIVQVVQEYVTLRRVGGRYTGLCPFHSEKTPSFNVNPDKGFFHCFGCSKSGDVIKFIELYDNVEFPEAVRLLAQKFGLTIPEMEQDGASRQDAGIRESLLKMHEIAAAYFREQLRAPAGARALKQLKERGVSETTLDQLGIGFAPNVRDGLKARLLKQGFSVGLALQSGLILQRDRAEGGGAGGGDTFDRFRGRIMVPIARESGSVIAFGGRAMDADQVPKYLNSPETPIYTKGKTLYGLNLSKAAIRKAGFAVLVEGYFDYAQVFQSQAAPVVASCGTALTPYQAHLLRRFTNRIVLSFDADTAGQGAASRSCDLLVEHGFDVNVLILDKGEDPDTFIRKHGGERYRERLRASQPYLEYLLDRGASGLDFGKDDHRRQFFAKMLGVAAKIPDAAARDQFADRIAHKARVSEEVVRTEIRKAAAQRKTELTARELPGAGPLKDAEKSLLWSLIHNTREAMAALDEFDPEDLAGLTAGRVFDLARNLKNSASERIPNLLLERLSTGDSQLVTSIAAASISPATPADCVQTLKSLRWERERADIQREIDRLQAMGASQHGTQIDALWQKKKDLLLRIEQLTLARNG
jgi:DNA primase